MDNNQLLRYHILLRLFKNIYIADSPNDLSFVNRFTKYALKYLYRFTSVLITLVYNVVK